MILASPRAHRRKLLLSAAEQDFYFHFDGTTRGSSNLQRTPELLPHGASQLRRQRDVFLRNVALAFFDWVEPGVKGLEWEAARLRRGLDGAKTRRCEEAVEMIGGSK